METTSNVLTTTPCGTYDLSNDGKTVILGTTTSSNFEAKTEPLADHIQKCDACKKIVEEAENTTK